jgi:hypothetical protein
LFYQSSGTFDKLKTDSKLRKCQLKLQPLIGAVSEYGKALDVYTNCYPLVLAPIWGSLRVVLQVRDDRLRVLTTQLTFKTARRFRKYFDRLVDIFTQIGDSLPRYRIYERLSSDHERLLAALANAYLDIIVSCIEAKEVFGKALPSQAGHQARSVARC